MPGSNIGPFLLLLFLLTYLSLEPSEGMKVLRVHVHMFADIHRTIVLDLQYLCSQHTELIKVLHAITVF